MTDTPARLFLGRAPAPGDTVFTAADLTTVREIVICNTDGEPRGAGQTCDVGISLVPSGDTAGLDNRIVPDQAVEPAEQVRIDCATVMEAGDALWVRASAPDRVTVCISGVVHEEES